MTIRLRVLAVAAMILVLVLLAWPRRWYNDDCFITFRYSRHIAAGHGYVWNAPDGERVEGGTSIAWTLLNAAAIRVGLDPVEFSQSLALVASALGLVLVLHAASASAASFALIAPLMLVAQRQWVLWSVSSHEMKLLTVVALAATARLAREVERGASGLASGALFLVAALFRPEAPLLHLAAGLGLVATGVSRTRLATVVRSGAVHGLGLAIVSGLRLAYFGLPFPNTFYAKVGAVQLDTGLAYLYQMTRQNFLWVFALVIVSGLVLGIAKSGLARAFVAQGILWCAWLGFQGGGRWEFGFLDPLLPGIAILCASAIAALHRRRALAAQVAGVAVLAASAIPLHRPFQATAVLEPAEHQRVVTDILASDARALAPYLSPSDRISIGWAGVLPYVTDAWHFDPWGLNDREIATRPFDVTAPLFHQRHALWSDMVSREVMFVDVYNRFLASAPLRPGEIHATANPWIEDGVPMYCVELPGNAKFRYWIFASPRPRPEIDAWLNARGLRLVWAEPFVPWRH